MTGAGGGSGGAGAGATILALDCSAASCSAALWRAGQLAGHRFEAMGRGQAEALMPMIETVMRQASTRYAELDMVAATVGPGSFTGLRIGLSAARGIALAAGIPARGVTTFAALAEAVAAERLGGRALAAAIDDRRGGVYWQEFDAALRPDGEPAILDRGQLAGLSARLPPGRALLVVGDGAALVGQELGAAQTGPEARIEIDRSLLLPDAACVARLAARADFAEHWRLPVPLYLRAAEARLPETPPSAPR